MKAINLVAMYEKQKAFIDLQIDEIMSSKIPLLSAFDSKGRVRLNLACGNHDKKGFVNVDLFKYKGINALWDISQPLPFEANSILEINLGNSIKHIKMGNLKKVLSGMVRVLVPDGNIDITFYDFGLVGKFYREKKVDIPYINTMLYGAEFKENQIHSLVLSKEWLIGAMEKFGCGAEGIKEDKWVRSIRFIKRGKR